MGGELASGFRFCCNVNVFLGCPKPFGRGEQDAGDGEIAPFGSHGQCSEDAQRPRTLRREQPQTIGKSDPDA